MIGGDIHGPVNGQRGSWTILLALERHQHHLCPYLLWSTCSVVTMSKCSIVQLFQIEHGFSNYLPYCRSVVIAVVCLYLCVRNGRGVEEIGMATTSDNVGTCC
jgi:hypothetical protein